MCWPYLGAYNHMWLVTIIYIGHHSPKITTSPKIVN